MKKVVLILLAFMYISCTYSQSKKVKKLIDEIEGQYQLDENKNLRYQKVFEYPGMTKSDLFQKSMEMVQAYASGNYKIETQDKESGIITATGYWWKFFELTSFISYEYSAFHKLGIEVQEGKAIVTLTVNKYEILSKTKEDSDEIKVNLSSRFPISKRSLTKNVDGKAFYALHQHCLEVLDKIEGALPKGMF